MDFKSLLSSLDQLSEATEKTKTGLKHTAEPGGYGRKDDEDEEGKKVKADAPKKGRGRPKKDADASGEVKKYDFSAFGSTGKDVKLKPWDKSKTTKHSLKEYFDDLDKALNEAEQVTIAPAQQNTQVIKQGTKTLGTVTNPQLAAQIKQSIGKGEMTLAGDKIGQEMAEDGDKWIQKAIKHPGALRKKLHAKEGEPIPAGKLEKATHSKNATTARQARLAQTLRGLKEAERPTSDSTMGAGLGAGRSQGVLETAKPDYIDLDKDGNKKETMKKAAKDKKKVEEGMNHRLHAARLEGKSHGLRKEGYNCRYDDMEEARAYHEGFKEGLDECYGQMGAPVMGEEGVPATVPGMADAAMDEGNAFTGALKQTPQGGKFSVGGKTFTDRSSIEESPFAFEAWDNQLNSLLESKEEISEGLSVSISKGQQGAPDSVSVNAQDGEADQLLAFLKQAGLGLFGGDEGQAQPGQASPMTLDTSDPAEVGTGGVAIDVVDDHDGMMNLIKKVVGAEPKGPEGGFADQEGGEEGQDYEDEGGHEGHEETCDACGSADCECDSEETTDEGVETMGGPADETQEEYMDQAEEEVAEEINPNNDDEAQEEQSDATRDAALAQAADNNEEQVDEGEYANSDDDTFAADIDFMTNVISGGLNKKKSTGQTTIPVIAGQEDRMTANESIVADWKKLAGIK